MDASLYPGDDSGDCPPPGRPLSVFLREIPGLYAGGHGGTASGDGDLCILFQLLFRRFHARQLGKMLVGLGYTYGGLVLFLVGVNVGFMPAGATIGAAIASGSMKWMLVPIGALVGYFIVRAEPAVQVLARQVEEISNGSITQKSINTALSIGISLSVGLAMVRILTGLNLMWFLIPGYAFSLIHDLFCAPDLYRRGL